MRKSPLRVAFVGGRGHRYHRFMAAISPAIQPITCSSWLEWEASASSRNPELVVVLPGVEPRPPFAFDFPILALDAETLEHDPLDVEARILSDPGTFRRVRPIDRLRGGSPAMARLRGTLETVASTELPLLLTGENGTGKDLAASVAHALSPRSTFPFVAVNCGAVPSTLAETEFFGCVRGAFTGAENRSGFCQQAQGGTLFLDEIGELLPELQSKLLRVLENQEIRRVGSPRVEATNFRLICATNRDLAADVKSGRFREDLFYRINLLPLRLPALRERKEDIPLLSEYFLSTENLGLAHQVFLGKSGLAKLSDYDWPGNLRQLRNVVLRAAVLHGGPELQAHHLDF